MVDESPKHWSPEEFRKQGYRVIDWVADYMEKVSALPVRSEVEPGSVFEKLPEEAPHEGEPFEAMLRDVDEIVMPGITHWNSPNFFAYFPANTSGPSILGDLISSGLGVQGMLWSTSPACTEVETRMMDWMAKLLGLPHHFLSSGVGGGVIEDSASSATLCAMLAARERATGGATNTGGLFAQHQRLVAYASGHAHSSIEKGARIAGIGSENLRNIAPNRGHAMCPEALRDAVEEDIRAGRRPFFVSATIGSTASGAFDALPALAEICEEHGIWLHADAAMYGIAAACPELRSIHDGVERVDSYTVNAHKWMLTGFDCNCFWVRDRQALLRALSILPEYLRNEATDSGRVIDYRDWQIPLGRRFRALKLWFVLRHYGVTGIQSMIRKHIALTQEFAEWVRGDVRFEVMAPHPLNLVCFRHRGGREVSSALMESANQTGKLFLTHCELDGEFALRFCVGQAQTQRHHVEAAWSLISKLAPPVDKG